jgi:hypothetical protein
MNPPPVPFGDPTRVNQENRAAVGKGLLFGCGALVVAAVVFVGLIVFGVLSLMRGSDVCEQAVAKAQASSRVQTALGQPITQGWYVTGSINTSNDSGSADVNIPISGPKGSATIHAVATKAAGVWTFSVLRVTLPDGKQVNLLPVTDVTSSRSALEVERMSHS